MLYSYIHTLMFIFQSDEDDCEYLRDPENGTVKHKGLNVGDKATYSCDNGYRLVGYSVRKCLYNGEWSHDEPECIKSKLNKLELMQVLIFMRSFPFNTIKVAVKICHIQSMAKSSNRGQILVPKQLIPVTMAIRELDIVQEGASTTENGQARSQNAKRVS